MPNATLEPLMTDAEVAAVLRVKPLTIRRWRASKKHPLAFVQLGRSIRYRQCDVSKFLSSQLVRPRGNKETD